MELICDKYRDMMSDFIDGELPKLKLDDFNNHLSGCLSCQNELEKLKKTIKIIHDSAYIPKKKLRESIITEIKQIKKKKSRFRYGSAIAACITAIVILTNFGFIYIFQNKINKSAQESVQIEDNTGSELKIDNLENADVYSSEEEISDESQPMLGITGIEPEGNSPEQTPERIKPAPAVLDTQSAEKMVLYNTRLYAPEYEDKITAVIISEKNPSADGELFKTASNYKVYLFEYTAETEHLLKENAEADGSTFFSIQPTKNSYILYVYLVQS